jgi:hypothetical protein
MILVRIRRLAAERRAALASEDGFIIVIVMMLIVIGLLVGAAALSEALGARTNANRSERSARALQAADAGIQTELYRANQINLGSLQLSSGLNLSSVLSQLLTCPIPQINASGQVIGLQFTAIASSGSPCSTNSSSGITNPGPNQEPVGHHSYFQVQMVPGTTNVGDFVRFNPKVVASGVDDTASPTDPARYVSRRVEAILDPITPWRTLEAAGNLTIQVPNLLSALGLAVAGTTTFNGTAAAGGNLAINGQGGVVDTFAAANISLSGGLTEPSALDYCGTYSQSSITLNLTLGSKTPVSPCNNLVSRPAIQISSSKQDCVPVAGVETCSSDAGFGSTYIGGNQDEIYNTNAGRTISFGPGDYVFCSFQTNGPVNLNPSSSQAVRIFIDSPTSSRCSSFASHSGVNAGNFTASKGVTNVLAATHPSQAQVYVVGNGTPGGTTVTSTSIGLANGQGMFLYAPLSNATISAQPSCVLTICTGVGVLAGAFVANNLTITATAITQDLGLLNYPLSGTLGPFHVKQYIECSPQYPLPSPDPTSGC